MGDQHPMALRAGGTGPSPTPPPQQQQQQQHSRRQSFNNMQMSGAQNSLQPQQGSSSSQMPNYSTRFPSSQYGAQSPSESPVNSPFGEPATTRSRSNTTGHNHPPSQQSYMTNPLPSQGIQPLFAQHTGHGNPAASSSRPVSRSAAMANMNPGPSARPTSAKSPFTSPMTSPPRSRPIQILLINPNSTRSMTESCLTAVKPTLPPGVELTGYTAPYPAPTAIESTTDAILSTEAVLRDLAKYTAVNGETVQNFDGMLVACYSKHPLIDALRECYDVPIIGIMEGSLYVARMLGGRFGIVATGSRSRFIQEDTIKGFYGFSQFYVGSEATHLGVLELESRARDDVGKRVAHACRNLVLRGADTIILGCAGMNISELIRSAKDAVRDDDGRRTVNIVDPVEAGIQMLVGLVGMGVPTSKKGIYKGEKEARRMRGQNWL